MQGVPPRCVILAGPNGAGKTSLYGKLSLPGEFINADVVAREIDDQRPEAASIAAGRRVLSMLASTLLNRLDFTYETTLSSHQAINLMKEARRLHYRIGLIFVALVSPDLHVLRVASRVLKGGHSIPENIIRRRYDQSLQNLEPAIGLSDEVAVYDNSGPEGPELKIEINDHELVYRKLEAANPLDDRLATIVSSALRRQL